MNLRAETFLQSVTLGDSRIQYPQDTIFFCGGKISADGVFRSLRHFLYSRQEQFFPTYSVVLAEKAAELFDARVYDDLMDFERHIASISRIVLLVSESPGSIAELGAFSQIAEISEKLLVFLHSDYYAESSFVKDGPIRYLERKNEQSVWEFDWPSQDDGQIEAAQAQILVPALVGAIGTFARVQNRTERFDERRIGHRLLLVGGVIQLLGCCKIREISHALEILGVEFNEKQVRQAIFCLKLFGWVKSVKRDTTYYIYSAPLDATLFRGPFWSRIYDISRERFSILREYEEDDPRLTALETTAV